MAYIWWKGDKSWISRGQPYFLLKEKQRSSYAIKKFKIRLSCTQKINKTILHLGTACLVILMHSLVTCSGISTWESSLLHLCYTFTKKVKEIFLLYTAYRKQLNVLSWPILPQIMTADLWSRRMAVIKPGKLQLAMTLSCLYVVLSLAWPQEKKVKCSL